jgi:ankyrin repeat protein
LPLPLTEIGKSLPDKKARIALTSEELTLHQAARDRIHEWFTKGQHLTKHQAKNTTLLLDASMVGHTEAARVLLEKGVRVLIERDMGDGVKHTALHRAALGGHTDVVCHSHNRVHEINDILNL